jgi:hypothetical protein
VLLYGSKTWTIKGRDGSRITAAGMKYLRRTAGYIWTDYKTNIQFAKELKITQFWTNARIQEKPDTTSKQNAS